MISFFYEGDLTRLGGGIVITDRIRKTPFSSDFLCELYINKKKYPARVHFPRRGGYEVRDIGKGKDEVLDYVMERLREDEILLITLVLRWVLKIVLLFMNISVVVFTVLMFGRFDKPHKLIGAGFVIVMSYTVFALNGALNRV